MNDRSLFRPPGWRVSVYLDCFQSLSPLASPRDIHHPGRGYTRPPVAEVPAARAAAAAAAEAQGEPDGASPASVLSRSAPLRAASPPPQHGHPAAAGGVRARDVSVRGPVLGKAGRPRPVPPRPSPRLFPSLPPAGGGGVGARWGPIPLPSVHGCGVSEGGRARRGAGRRRRRKRRPGAAEPLCLAEVRRRRRR